MWSCSRKDRQGGLRVWAAPRRHQENQPARRIVSRSRIASAPPPSSKSFLFVLAASQGPLLRLLHRVSTFLALVGERRIPALVLLEAHPTHRRPALHALLHLHR